MARLAPMSARADSIVPDRRAAVLRLGALFAALFLHNGVHMPFFPLWLAARGLTGGEIAVLVALPLVVRVAATPAVAHLADRRGHIAGVLTLCALGAAVGYAGLVFSFDFATTALAIAFIAATQGPVSALIDALTVSEVRAARTHPDGAPLSYGRIRLWGSLAFMAGNLLGGLVVGLAGVPSVVFMLAGAAALCAVVACEALPLFPATPPERLSDAGAPPPAPLRIVGAVIGAAALIQASHALAYTFATLHWRAKGLPDLFLGFGWTIGIFAEVALFRLSGQIFTDPRRAGLLLVSGGAAASVRWLLMAGDPGPALLLALQLLHGVSFGATHLGTVGLIGALTPPSMRARAQGWVNSVLSLSTALFIAAGGPLYERLGEAAYLVMAAAAAAGLLLAALAARGAARIRV